MARDVPGQRIEQRRRRARLADDRRRRRHRGQARRGGLRRGGERSQKVRRCGRVHQRGVVEPDAELARDAQAELDARQAVDSQIGVEPRIGSDRHRTAHLLQELRDQREQPLAIRCRSGAHSARRGRGRRRRGVRLQQHAWPDAAMRRRPAPIAARKRLRHTDSRQWHGPRSP
jgi:hypothetical protein